MRPREFVGLAPAQPERAVYAAWAGVPEEVLADVEAVLLAAEAEARTPEPEEGGATPGGPESDHGAGRVPRP